MNKGPGPKGLDQRVWTNGPGPTGLDWTKGPGPTRKKKSPALHYQGGGAQKRANEKEIETGGQTVMPTHTPGFDPDRENYSLFGQCVGGMGGMGGIQVFHHLYNIIDFEHSF